MNKCEVCGNEFEAKRSTSKYCSGACRAKASRVSARPDVSARNIDPLSARSEDAKDVSARSTVTDKIVDVTGEPGVDLTTIGITTLDMAKDLKLDIRKDLGCMGFSPDGIFINPDITIAQVRSIRRIIEAKHGWTHREYDGPQKLYNTSRLLVGAR